jgi:hypothetical protein
VGLQTIQETKYYVSPQILSHHNLEKTDYNPVFYTPRTLSTMVFGLIMLNIFAYSVVPLHSAADINEENPKDGFKYTSKM